MPIEITAPAGYPQEVIALVQSFNACCQDAETTHVVEAASNFLVCAIRMLGEDTADDCGCGNARGHAIAVAKEIKRNLIAWIDLQFDEGASDLVHARRN